MATTVVPKVEGMVAIARAKTVAAGLLPGMAGISHPEDAVQAEIAWPAALLEWGPTMCRTTMRAAAVVATTAAVPAETQTLQAEGGLATLMEWTVMRT